MKQPSGTLKFCTKKVSVYQHGDGYLVWDNKEVIMLDFKPVYIEDSLLRMFHSTTTPFARFQLAKHGNVAKEGTGADHCNAATEFDKWYKQEAALEEMCAMGY